MSDKCQWPISCHKLVEKNGYCFMHNKLSGGEKTTGAKAPAPIAKESKKRKEENKIYKKVKAEKFAASDRCELKIPGICTGKAEGLDHVQKRSPKNLTKAKNLVRACNACNYWKETHPKEAAIMGISKSRFAKDTG